VIDLTIILGQILRENKDLLSGCKLGPYTIIVYRGKFRCIKIVVHCNFRNIGILLFLSCIVDCSLFLVLLSVVRCVRMFLHFTL